MNFPRYSWKQIGGSFAFWSFIALVFTAEAYLDYLTYGKQISWARTLTWELIGWYLWGALTLLIFGLARRLPPQKHLLLHVPFAFLFAAVHLSLHFWLFQLSELFVIPTDPIMHLNFVSRIAWRIMVYFIILLSWYAMDSQRRARLEERRASELSAQLANAQLQALKTQIHPHFLFNTLNSISELMHHDIRTADEMMVRLGDFLRLTLDPSISQEVTLEKELEFLKHYLEIEQIRFKDRLKIQMRIDPDTRNARVPYLLLQPVVENAIRHGISRKAEGGTVEITTEKDNGFLRILIQDDGKGMPQNIEPEASSRTGLGLSNTRSRLERMYGDRFRFELSNRTGSGTNVSLTIPFVEET